MAGADFKAGVAWIRERGEQLRNERKKVANRFLSAVEGGKSITEARAEVLESFRDDPKILLTERKLDHILERAVTLPPGVAVDMAVRQERICQKADESLELILLEADSLVCQIDAQIEHGDEWYNLKYESGETGKGPIEKTEKITLSEAKRRVLDWRQQAIKTHADILKTFRADIQVSMNNIYAQYDSSELDKKIAELEKTVKRG